MAGEYLGFSKGTISPSDVFRKLQNFECSHLFIQLRNTNGDVRRDLLSEALRGKEEYFPNGEVFAGELAELLGYRWLEPGGSFTTNTISENVERIRGRLEFDKKMPISIVTDMKKAQAISTSVSENPHWKKAWKVERDRARDALQIFERYYPWEVARKAGETAVRGSIEYQARKSTQRRVGSHLQWMMLQDVLGDESPFLGMMNLYKEGLWPIGETGEGFIIYRPLKK